MPSKKKNTVRENTGDLLRQAEKGFSIERKDSESTQCTRFDEQNPPFHADCDSLHPPVNVNLQTAALAMTFCDLGFLANRTPNVSHDGIPSPPLDERNKEKGKQPGVSYCAVRQREKRAPGATRWRRPYPQSLKEALRLLGRPWPTRGSFTYEMTRKKKDTAFWM